MYVAMYVCMAVFVYALGWIVLYVVISGCMYACRHFIRAVDMYLYVALFSMCVRSSVL